jgi:hypothetical protein
MSRERRETKRRHTYLPAFLYTTAGTPLGKCIVKDISEQGANIIYSAVEELPDELVLTMGMNRQNCRVMWRRQKEVGVQFGTAKAPLALETVGRN